MAAPKENQYWKLRSKHGRDRIIQDPQTLADASDEYFQWCIDNPIIQIEYKSAGGELIKVELPHPRVFKKGELARFCNVSEWDVINDLRSVSEDFIQVITRIEGIIRDQKYTYAVVGMFNSNIVARDLGLVDHKEMKQTNINQLEDKEDKELDDEINNLKK